MPSSAGSFPLRVVRAVRAAAAAAAPPPPLAPEVAGLDEWPQ